MADANIPIAYGTPIDDPGKPRMGAAPSTAMPDLRTATALNGGRSSRILLPQDNSNNSQPAMLTDEIFETLADQGYTRGLAEALMKNQMAFPLNFWIVDNSGSMNKQDGHRFVVTKRKNNVKFVECTRWAEMQQTVDYHVQMAALLKTPTVFRLLNDPGRIHGPQQFSIAEDVANLDRDLAIAQSTILNTTPSGVTPLTDHLIEIRNNLLELQPQLRANGTKVVIVIATDGTPTDAQGYSGATAQDDFVRALKALEGLPVWIVVRLCTDDDAIVDYWNNLDSQLELSLEVLDDFSAEAAEIYEYNKWLNYGLPIHRMREKGFYHKLFDLLDERKLSKDELREFLRILFGDGKMDGVPDPQADWNGFYEGVSRIVNSEGKQWNPITKKMAPWIDLRQMKRDFGPGWFHW